MAIPQQVTDGLNALSESIDAAAAAVADDAAKGVTLAGATTDKQASAQKVVDCQADEVVKLKAVTDAINAWEAGQIA